MIKAQVLKLSEPLVLMLPFEKILGAVSLLVCVLVCVTVLWCVCGTELSPGWDGCIGVFPDSHDTPLPRTPKLSSAQQHAPLTNQRCLSPTAVALHEKKQIKHSDLFSRLCWTSHMNTYNDQPSLILLLNYQLQPTEKSQIVKQNSITICWRSCGSN